jgi:hypothetical protein
MIREYFLSLIPEYTNNSLGPVKSWILSWWLKFDPSAHAELKSFQHLRDAVNSQPLTAPSSGVYHRIQVGIQASSNSSPKSESGFWVAWAGGMTLIFLSIILLWNVLPPGITLQWSVQGGQPAKHRVYRAEATRGNENFELVYEIPAASDTHIYTFKDILLIPGKEYVYRIEVVDQNGLSSDSQTVKSNALEALPGQLALLASLIITVYGVSLVIKKQEVQLFQLV